jgi:hypothetical protein
VGAMGVVGAGVPLGVQQPEGEPVLPGLQGRYGELEQRRLRGHAVLVLTKNVWQRLHRASRVAGLPDTGTAGSTAYRARFALLRTSYSPRLLRSAGPGDFIRVWIVAQYAAGDPGVCPGVGRCMVLHGGSHAGVCDGAPPVSRADHKERRASHPSGSFIDAVGRPSSGTARPPSLMRLPDQARDFNALMPMLRIPTTVNSGGCQDY